MRYNIIHEIPGRIRLNIPLCRATCSQDFAELFQSFYKKKWVSHFSFNPKTKNLLVEYKVYGDIRNLILGSIDNWVFIPTNVGSKQDLNSKKNELLRRFLYMLTIAPFEPIELKPFLAIIKNRTHLLEGVKSIHSRTVNTELLDAVAIGTAIGIGDYFAAGMTSLLLDLGDYLSDWTQQQVKTSLNQLFSFETDKAWIEDENGEEKEIPFDEIKIGIKVIIRAGSQIPVDGIVLRGDAMVNQSSLTGESVPIHKMPESTVYAGTVIEEGELVVQVIKSLNESKIAKIAELIENSQAMKANVQVKAEIMADKLVPVILGLGLTSFILTGNLAQMASIVMVDYSCAIKLSTPLCIISAILELSKRNVLVKGGKYIEKMANMNLFVMDKTGTLTKSKPEIHEILGFNGYEKDEILLLAACLEEHFPHPIGKAIVEKAKEMNLLHETEKHSEIEYIVAHGIISTIQGNKVLLGSHHFIHDDHSISLSGYDEILKPFRDNGHSILYFVIDNHVAGVFIIIDPIREDATRFLKDVKEKGVHRIVMLTGDNKLAATNVAKSLGITEFVSEILPDQKLSIVERLKSEGNVVAMVGDGINDSPALSAADIGISMNHGSDLAQEVADVILFNEGLDALVKAKTISQKSMERISKNYTMIATINSALLGFSFLGISSPLFSALSHNLTTILVTLNSLRPYQPKSKEINIRNRLPTSTPQSCPQLSTSSQL